MSRVAVQVVLCLFFKQFSILQKKKNKQAEFNIIIALVSFKQGSFGFKWITSVNKVCLKNNSWLWKLSSLLVWVRAKFIVLHNVE